MPQLTVTVQDKRGALGGADLNRRLKALVDAERTARQEAARAATNVTRANFHYRREIITPRPGRSSTGGQMTQYLRWTAGTDRVTFDVAEADEHVPHWIIQEIGTGERATLRQAARSNPVGRPSAGATYIRSVKSQRGRRISGGLVFATGGRYSPPGVRRDEQLHWASQVLGVPHRSGKLGRQAASIRISREIEGQHFVQKGGAEGFREYRQSVLAAARQAFRKSNRS
jgi:hypothetical protein